MPLDSITFKSGVGNYHYDDQHAGEIDGSYFKPFHGFVERTRKVREI